MKKLIGLLLSASLIAGSGLSAFAATPKFSDISDERYAWAKDYIEQMAQEGYIAGYEDNTYRPDNKVTRLETIVLFSRAMGSNKAENKEIVELAKEQYSDILDGIQINFGYDEVAYMLYREALSEDDAVKYLGGEKSAQAMPRQEAAAIITKAMCGDEEAKAELLTDMDYTDTKDIDSDYTQYVFYVSEKGIMNGMDDGRFEPESSVLRSQIAAMLFRTVEKMHFYVETVPIVDIDTVKNNITIVDNEQSKLGVGYANNTKFFLDGEIASENDVILDEDATLTYINDKLAFIDMKTPESKATLKGILQGTNTYNDKTTVVIKNTKDDETAEYSLAPNAKVYKEDGQSLSDIKNMAVSSYVEFETVNDRITKISQLKKISTITDATVESIKIDRELLLTISHSDSEYDGMTFVLGDDIVVYKNNDHEDLSKIYKGDRVNITTEYGVVTKIVAVSNTNNYNGAVKEVRISQNSSITVTINGDDKVFEVVPSVKISVGGEDATLYDLRVGDSVKITSESGVVLEIAATAASVSGSPVTGTVEVVNASKGFITVNGQTIFCKDSSTAIVTSNGTTKMMKDVKVGDNVSVRGTMNNGAYTASLIIIE